MSQPHEHNTTTSLDLIMRRTNDRNTFVTPQRIIASKNVEGEKKSNLAHFIFVGFLLVSSFLLIIQLEGE